MDVLQVHLMFQYTLLVGHRIYFSRKKFCWRISTSSVLGTGKCVTLAIHVYLNFFLRLSGKTRKTSNLSYLQIVAVRIYIIISSSQLLIAHQYFVIFVSQPLFNYRIKNPTGVIDVCDRAGCATTRLRSA